MGLRMKFERLGSWFLSPAGKTFASSTAVVIGTGIACSQIAPHTLLLNNYKEHMQLYKNGCAVPVPQDIGERFQKTLNLLEISESDKKQFKAFMVQGFDVFSAGTFFGHSGVIIGTPLNFTYSDSSTIDKNAIQISNQPVQWELDEAKLLLKSLTLSESAQMYAIAREIVMRKGLKYFFDLFNSMFFFIIACVAARRFNTVYDLYARPRFVRLISYTLLSVYCLFLYIFVTDIIQSHFEEEVDTYLKNKHHVFIEGGKEFYTSLLNRNIALRSLMGNHGESKYTAVGEENSVRQKHLPLLVRRDFFNS